MSFKQHSNISLLSLLLLSIISASYYYLTIIKKYSHWAEHLNKYIYKASYYHKKSIYVLPRRDSKRYSIYNKKSVPKK